MRKYLVILVLAPALCAQIAPRGSRGSGRPQGKQAGISPLETPVATFHGTLRSVTKKELVLDLAEEQSVTFHISGKTRFLKDAKSIKLSALVVGATLTVDGKRDVRGNTDAVTVTVDPKPK